MVVDAEWDHPISESDKKKASEQEAILTKIFNEIFKKYSPTTSLSHSDLQITTNELLNKISEHYPIEGIDIDLVFKVMQGAGYHYTTFPNKIEFVWLLRKRG